MNENPLTPDHLRRLRDLFDKAIDLPENERSSFLSSLALNEPGLADEVKELLDAAERSGDTWVHPAAAAAQAISNDPLGASDRGQSGKDLIGHRIGVYEIVRLIGMGGMGAVYEGIRVDDQYHKRVALKFLRKGVEGDAAIRRFRNERQILASLEHRNIASLLDGGVTAEGEPYIVMEFVDGEPLTQYADSQRLDTRARIRLFRQVCAAVQYAHQHFVVHRDLKPGNILVTADGSVKLLDFGIARLTREIDSSEQMPATVGGALAFTPEYASPEQIRGLPVSAASDIYSLGVIATELLTGKRPYSLEGLIFSEAQEVIVRKPAVAPSELVTETSASLRGMRASRLSRELSGDLDAILLQTLRKEPERRYASVEQLSNDLNNYLTGLPVTARRDTLAYRTGKFIRRRHLELSALSLILISLVGGIAATSRQARKAAIEQRKLEQVNSFLSNMLSSVDPAAAGPNVTVAEVLSQAAHNIEQEHLDPEIEAQIRHTLGQTYYALSMYDSSEMNIRRAWELRRRVYGDLDQRTSMSLSYVAAIEEAKGDFTKAESLQRVLVDNQRRMPRDQYSITELATALDNLARSIEQQGRLDDALKVKLEAIDLRRKAPEDSSSMASLPYTLIGVAVSYAYQGRLAAAESLVIEALDTEARVHGPESFNTGSILRMYASLLDDMDQPERADSTIRRSIAVLTRVAGPTQYETLRSKAMLAQLRYSDNDMQSAIAAAREVLPEIGKSMPDADPTSSSVLQTLGLALDSVRNFVAADTFLLRSRELRRTYMPPDHWAVANADAVYGFHLGRWGGGRQKEAERLMLSSYDRLVETRGAEASVTRLAASRLSELYKSMGRDGDAEKWQKLGVPPT